MNLTLPLQSRSSSLSLTNTWQTCLHDAIELTDLLLVPSRKINDDPLGNGMALYILEKCTQIWYEDSVDANRSSQMFDFNKSSFGWHPIHLAVLTGNQDLINQILIMDTCVAANAEYHLKGDTITPLMCAAAKDLLHVMLLLMENGAMFSVDATKELEWAVKGNSVSCFHFITEKAEFLSHDRKIDIFGLFMSGTLGNEAFCILDEILLITGQSSRSSQRRFEASTLNIGRRMSLSNIFVMDSKELFWLSLSKGYGDILKVLLKHDANPNLQTAKGLPALHYAILYNTKDDGAEKVLLVLLNNGAHVNTRDSEGRTALNLAAKSGFKKCAFALINRKAEICVNDLKNLTERVPCFLKMHLDSLIYLKGITSSPTGELVYIDIGFMGKRNSKKWKEEGLKNRKDYMELNFLEYLIQDGQEDLLMHPVIQTYLYTKWIFCKKFFYLSIMLYILQLICLTTFISVRYCTPNQPNRTCLFEDYNVTTHNHYLLYDLEGLILSLSLLGTSCLIISRTGSLINYIVHRLFKIFLFQRVVEIILICLVILAIIPLSSGKDIPSFQREIASVALLLAWCNTLFFLGRHPVLGIYVEMLKTVFKNFAKFFLTYTCFLIGFAVSFSVLRPTDPDFRTLTSSIQQILTWMIGEMNSKDNCSQESFLTKILYISFILFVTVALVNLLIGLAVHDIQGLLLRSKIHRSIRQVQYLHLIESIFYSNAVADFFPIWLKKQLRKSIKITSDVITIFPNKSDDKRLPYELKQEAFIVAKQNNISESQQC